VLKSGRVLRTKEKQMNNTKTITTYPCQVDPALRADCLSKSAHVGIFDFRPHYCGASFEQEVDVVEVEFVPAKRTSQRELRALRVKAHKSGDWSAVHSANKANKMVPQWLVGREGTGARKYIKYSVNRQGKNVRAYQITDLKLGKAWTQFNAPQLPATV